MVLRHQFFNVCQHQHATTRQPRQFRYITRVLPAPVGSTITAGFYDDEMVERGIHGSLADMGGV